MSAENSREGIAKFRKIYKSKMMLQSDERWRYSIWWELILMSMRRYKWEELRGIILIDTSACGASETRDLEEKLSPKWWHKLIWCDDGTNRQWDATNEQSHEVWGIWSDSSQELYVAVAELTNQRQTDSYWDTKVS